MSSLIEQAAKRLEQLRAAGVAVPEPVAAAPIVRPVPAAADGAPAAEEPKPMVTSRRVDVDFATLAAAGFVTPDAPRSPVADEFRVLKRPLIRNAMGKGASLINHGNLVMVTSALPGEGKTFTSINLALSIAAELDNTVMLVDADVARPSVLNTLGLPPGPGLLDMLDGHAEMHDVLLKTNIDKLTILPSGTPHARATELLASEAMRALLEDMARRYPDRIIIFDSPPLLLTTESRVLASQMGQVVVVVQAERTLRADVQQAVSMIESCPVRMMVLNKARGGGVAGYGYGRGYGYGYGYGESQQAVPG